MGLNCKFFELFTALSDKIWTADTSIEHLLCALNQGAQTSFSPEIMHVYFTLLKFNKKAVRDTLDRFLSIAKDTSQQQPA